MLTSQPVGNDGSSAGDNTRGLRVVVFSSQKGGSGKTTLCGHLAV